MPGLKGKISTWFNDWFFFCTLKCLKTIGLNSIYRWNWRYRSSWSSWRCWFPRTSRPSRRYGTSRRGRWSRYKRRSRSSRTTRFEWFGWLSWTQRWSWWFRIDTAASKIPWICVRTAFAKDWNSRMSAEFRKNMGGLFAGQCNRIESSCRSRSWFGRIVYASILYHAVHVLWYQQCL